MRVSDKHKLIFFSTPKCGSHTGWKLMEKNFWAQKIKGTGMHTNVVPAKYKEYSAFTFTRNPYERAISQWNAVLKAPLIEGDFRGYRQQFLKLVGSDDFTKFCRWLSSVNWEKNPTNLRGNLMYPQYILHDRSNLVNKTFIKLENIESDLPRYLKEITGKEISVIPYELKRDHPTWEELKTPETEELIRKWAKEDFKRYEY